MLDSASDDDIVPNKPNQNNGIASFILKTKNDYKPKNKTICCNSMHDDELPLELEFEDTERPITHRQMNGTRTAFNTSHPEIAFVDEKRLYDQERSSNQSRSLYAKANSCYFEPSGKHGDMDEHTGNKK